MRSEACSHQQTFCHVTSPSCCSWSAPGFTSSPEGSGGCQLSWGGPVLVTWCLRRAEKKYETLIPARHFSTPEQNEGASGKKKIKKIKTNCRKKGILYVGDQMEKPYCRVNHTVILSQKSSLLSLHKGMVSSMHLIRKYYKWKLTVTRVQLALFLTFLSSI